MNISGEEEKGAQTENKKNIEVKFRQSNYYRGKKRQTVEKREAEKQKQKYQMNKSEEQKARTRRQRAARLSNHIFSGKRISSRGASSRHR